jgi:glycerol-3-phosphate dehydrogenase
LCEELGVDFERTSQYVCFTKLWIKPILYLSLFFLWKRIKIPTKITGKKELRLMIPGINKNIVVALDFPSTGVVCPYNLTIACGENAVENGVKISLNTSVLNMETKEGSITAVHTNRGILHPKIVINAAGVFSDDIAAMAGDRFFSIHPRRGTNIILDKKFTKSIALISLSKKTDPSAKTHTKGGGIIRTVHWNILVGPDAVETPLREDFAVQKESVETTIQRFSASSAKIDMSQIITYFTGVRAPSFEEDFIVCKGRRCANLVHAAAIQSPGLTAAPAIAIDVARMTAEVLEASGQKVLPNKNFNPVRKRIPHIAVMSDEERAEMIKQNPDYGIILCRCEEVSKGEIIDALRRPVPCDTIDGVKRRVRSGMGRCQGGFCSPLILQIIAHEKNIPFEQVTKNGPGSKVLYKPTK